jgi:hypothetical protein
MNVLRWTCFLVLLASATHVGTATPKTGLYGTVSDIHGVAVPKALKPRIVIRWDESGTNIGLKSNVGIPTDAFVETDSTGRFQADVPPGFYDVFVSAFGFAPACRKVRIRPGQVLAFNPKLDISLTVQKELADKPF